MLELSLAKSDCMLLAKAFKDASEFTKEKDDFHTMTGFNWEDAIALQKDLDRVATKTAK